jgi:hypothetical protein
MALQSDSNPVHVSVLHYCSHEYQLPIVLGRKELGLHHKAIRTSIPTSDGFLDVYILVKAKG